MKRKKNQFTYKMPKNIVEFYEKVYKPESTYHDIGDISFEEFAKSCVLHELESAFIQNNLKDDIHDMAEKISYAATETKQEDSGEGLEDGN